MFTFLGCCTDVLRTVVSKIFGSHFYWLMVGVKLWNISFFSHVVGISTFLFLCFDFLRKVQIRFYKQCNIWLEVVTMKFLSSKCIKATTGGFLLQKVFLRGDPSGDCFWSVVQKKWWIKKGWWRSKHRLKYILQTFAQSE